MKFLVKWFCVNKYVVNVILKLLWFLIYFLKFDVMEFNIFLYDKICINYKYILNEICICDVL